MMFRQYFWLLLPALILTSTPLGADETASSPATDAVERVAGETGRAGVQVFVDRESGEVRSPTKAEIAKIAEQFRQRFIEQAVEKPIVHHADGSMSRELGPQHRLYSVARITDDGKLETLCLPAEQAADFLAREDPYAPGVDGRPAR